MESFADKTFVLMGGTSGMGLSAAKALAQAGANVVLNGRDPEKLKAALAEVGEKAVGLAADATDADTSERVIALGESTFGNVIGLYHVAGGSGRRYGDGPLHEITDEGIAYTLELNLVSLIRSNRAMVKHLLGHQRAGSILNMSSVLGVSPAPRLSSAQIYAATKSAVIGFSKSIASYYASQNIRVNVISPGLVATPMAGRVADDDEIQSYLRTKQPLDGGRSGLAEDLDTAVLFLLSPASRFVTGQVVAVDGGWSVSEGQYPPSERVE